MSCHVLAGWQAKEARREREAQVAKVQMEAALHKGVSWGMAGDDQVLCLPSLLGHVYLSDALFETSPVMNMNILLSFKRQSCDYHQGSAVLCIWNLRRSCLAGTNIALNLAPAPRQDNVHRSAHGSASLVSCNMCIV